MPKPDQSHCQMTLLHIDALLDGDLELSRRQEMDAHLTHCGACRAELEYAQRLHFAVLQLPALDCSSQALEPVGRLLNAHGNTESGHRPAAPRKPWLSWWQDRSWAVRYAMPGMVAMLILVVLGQTLLPRIGDDAIPVLAVSQPPEPIRYTEAEIQQAMADLEFALSYLESVSQRTSTLVRNEILAGQLAETINASARIRNNDPQAGTDAGIDGPI